LQGGRGQSGMSRSSKKKKMLLSSRVGGGDLKGKIVGGYEKEEKRASAIKREEDPHKDVDWGFPGNLLAKKKRKG